MKRLLVVLAVGLLALAAGTGTARALESGDVVQFLIPISETQPELGAVLLFIGGPTGTTVGTGCVTTGSYPTQRALLFPSGQGSTGPFEVITTFQTVLGGGSDPIEPGTKVTNILFLGDCNIGATSYKKYTGTVE